MPASTCRPRRSAWDCRGSRRFASPARCGSTSRACPWSAASAQGDATLRWRAAGSALTPVSPLGDYEVHFKAVGAAVHAELRTLAGPLQLDGKGTWANGSRAELPRHGARSAAAPGAAVAAVSPHRHRARRRHFRAANPIGEQRCRRNTSHSCCWRRRCCPRRSGANEGVARCAKLENTDERLACYDELARADRIARRRAGRPFTDPDASHRRVEARRQAGRHAAPDRHPGLPAELRDHALEQQPERAAGQPGARPPVRAAGPGRQRAQVPGQPEDRAGFAPGLRAGRRHAAARPCRHRQRAPVVRLYAGGELAGVQRAQLASVPRNELRARRRS